MLLVHKVSNEHYWSMKFKKRALLVSSLIFISCLLQIFYFIKKIHVSINSQYKLSNHFYRLYLFQSLKNPNPNYNLHTSLHNNINYEATTAIDFITKSKSHCRIPQLLTKATPTLWWSSTSNIKNSDLYKIMDWLQKPWNSP